MIEAARRYFLPRRHSVLLIAVVVTFAVRPLIGENNFSRNLFGVAVVLLLIMALYTVQIDDLIGEKELLLVQRHRRMMIGWLLAFIAIVERLVSPFFPNPALILTGTLSFLLFFSYITWALLRSLLRHKEVTGQTIAMSVTVYLLLGVSWGFLFALLFQLDPHAFNFGAANAGTTLREPDFTVAIYFSLTTLATVGYGDITPVTLQARYASVAEGIAGQFYLAILVARLVGMHMSRAISDSSKDSTPPPPA